MGLLGASGRWIKMVGYRGALHFCLFFFFAPFLQKKLKKIGDTQQADQTYHTYVLLCAPLAVTGVCVCCAFDPFAVKFADMAQVGN